MHSHPEERERRRAQSAQLIKEYFGIEDMHGAEVLLAFFRIVHQANALASVESEGPDLSPPRWRVLLQLFIDEKLNRDSEGPTPTELSRYQQVSKNTMSTLLRGLEEQGLIQRELHPQDLRIFRIRLTDAGRRYVLSSTPRRIAAMNQVMSALSADEIQQLSRLLRKLSLSLESKSCPVQKDQN